MLISHRQAWRNMGQIMFPILIVAIPSQSFRPSYGPKHSISHLLDKLMVILSHTGHDFVSYCRKLHNLWHLEQTGIQFRFSHSQILDGTCLKRQFMLFPLHFFHCSNCMDKGFPPFIVFIDKKGMGWYEINCLWNGILNLHFHKIFVKTSKHEN